MSLHVERCVHSHEAGDSKRGVTTMSSSALFNICQSAQSPQTSGSSVQGLMIMKSALRFQYQQNKHRCSFPTTRAQ